MLKRLGFFCVVFISLMGYAKAEVGGTAHKPSVKDTVDLEAKDSFVTQEVTTPAPDPKSGFKDLFANSPASSNDISIEKLNPLVLGFVKDYMAKSGKKTEAMKGWGKPYFDVMDKVLTKHGLPKELKYLAVVESDLKTNARSWVGAVGPWQLMPTTAKGLGLRINRNVDERRDIYKSTHAASRYLTTLFSMYGDWLMVLAAYNGGPGKVNSAIKRSGSRNYWVLQKYLPAESRRHVKKYIAVHYIMERGGGITTLTKAEAANRMIMAVNNSSSNDEQLNEVKQLISGRSNSSVLIKHIEMDILAFNKFNPNFDKEIAFNGKYELRLPSEKMDLFTTKKTDILNESMQLLLNAETVAAGTR